VQTYAITDVGRQRSTNEDDVLVESFGETILLVVADGMGGHAAGDVASETATGSIRRSVEEALAAGREQHETILEDAIISANERVSTLIEDDPSLSGMGTTVVAALIEDKRATFANVGDSRGYHIGDGIEQVTVDQSLVQELVDSGQITEAEAKEHPQRNVVSQALGTTSDIDPEYYEQQITGTLLLCSDGLTEEVDEEYIERVVADDSSLEATARLLVESANENGGSDNISLVLAEA
jgi:protein phosphatase